MDNKVFSDNLFQFFATLYFKGLKGRVILNKRRQSEAIFGIIGNITILCSQNLVRCSL